MKNEELEDIKKRSGKYCPFSKMVCSDNDCHLKDNITGACLFWLINSNLYHQNKKLDELNERLEELIESDKGDTSFSLFGFGKKTEEDLMEGMKQCLTDINYEKEEKDLYESCTTGEKKSKRKCD